MRDEARKGRIGSRIEGSQYPSVREAAQVPEVTPSLGPASPAT